MPRGTAGAPAWFVLPVKLVTVSRGNIRTYLDNTIGSDNCTIHHVAKLASVFARLRLRKLKLSPDNARIGAAGINILGFVISAVVVRPNDNKVAALSHMPMSTDIKNSLA